MADKKLANRDRENLTKEKKVPQPQADTIQKVILYVEMYMLLDRKPKGNDKYPNDLEIPTPVSEATQRFYAHFLKY